MILLKFTAAAQAVTTGGQHLLSSLRLEALLQKHFIRLYDFRPPHRVGELWVFQCEDRTRPLPLSERIADKDYAELAVERQRAAPKQVTSVLHCRKRTAFPGAEISRLCWCAMWAAEHLRLPGIATNVCME